MRPTLDRRALAKALSRAADATVADVLAAAAQPAVGGVARRIGITGAPGTGKSTLISELVRERLAGAERLGVLAIDPTSPFSGGAILGDRVRMDAVVQDERLFIRSFASRSAHDGLTENVAQLLTVLDRHAFDEVILETVGVGQTEYAVRTLVDTVVLVLIPESGDHIQAMKAGLMETADVYVINKADLPNARRVANDVRTILTRSGGRGGGWRPAVVETSAAGARGIDELSRILDRHQRWLAGRRDGASVLRARRAVEVQALLARRVRDLIEATDLDRPVRDIYDAILARLAGDRHGPRGAASAPQMYGS
jgi:LAO/AO transport system kinase